MIKANKDFQEKMEKLKEKYPLLKTLYEQGVTYETLPDCLIKRQIDKELGIVGWEMVPIITEGGE